MGQSKPDLCIGGFTPFSTIDYPNALAAVIFCQGCPWRCRYCHNPELLSVAEATDIQWAEIMALLKRRCGLLDAVVFSGGEPTYQEFLIDAVQQVIELGYRVGLHTAGYDPKRLRLLLPLLDWIGLDIKAPESKYRSITGALNSGAAAWESASLVIASGKEYEIRITQHPALLTSETVNKMLTDLRQLGAKRMVVQACRTGTMFDTTLPAMSADFVDLEN